MVNTSAILGQKWGGGGKVAVVGIGWDLGCGLGCGLGRRRGWGELGVQGGMW